MSQLCITQYKPRHFEFTVKPQKLNVKQLGGLQHWPITDKTIKKTQTGFCMDIACTSIMGSTKKFVKSVMLSGLVFVVVVFFYFVLFYQLETR